MKKTALLIPLSIIPVSVLLVGCAGGGGSAVGSVVSVPVAPTTIRDNSPVLLDAISNEVDYRAIEVIIGGVPESKAILTEDRGISKTSTANLTYDSGGNLSKLVITPNSALGSSISWDVASGGAGAAVPSTTDYIVLNDAGNTYDVLAVDPNTSAFDYQTFGVWATGKDPAAAEGTIGVLSAGLKTPAASVPAAGGPTFTGKLLGFHVDTGGVGRFVTGTVSIESNFSARTLLFSTTGTSAIIPSIGVASAKSSLDMTGTLTYAAGTNLFVGNNVSTVGGLTGDASGAFYGPNAEEIGGVFNVKAASGVEFYSGSFGAKQ